MKKILLLLFSLVLLAACYQDGGTRQQREYREDSKPHSNRNDRNSQCYNSTYDENYDAQINSRVNDAIMNDNSIYSIARYVNVSTTNRVVTLTGSVQSQDDSRRIEKKVKNVDGVKRVNNQLTINH